MTDTRKIPRTIHIPNDTVRDSNITPNDFAIVLYLKMVVFDHGNTFEFDEDVNRIKYLTNIKDNKTLKKSLKNLYDNNYLLEKTPENFVQGKPVRFSLNRDKFETDTNFTMLPMTVLTMVSEGRITRECARLIYYYESRVNRNNKRMFCFASEISISEETGIKAVKTIRKHNSILKREKLIDIKKGKLGWDYQYDEDGNPIFGKYNNHYYVNWDKLV
ncbi:hypothetical protein H6F38_23230 [Paenibacillus sp. EKM208P]|nr:hypothetical protein H6F38_23230 [Paenibacillus sp. EKM208P]